MTVRVVTPNPTKLLAAIYAAIDGKGSGRSIATWSYDDDKDLQHAKTQATVKNAWFSPSTTATELLFGIIPPKDTTLDSFSYAYHHGHLVQMLVDHFSTQFSAIGVTPYPQ